MSDESTTKMVSVYEQTLDRPRYFSSHFATTPDSFHNADKVEYDVVRQGQDIAVPVPDATSGPRLVEEKKWVNYELTPVVFNYEARIAASEVRKRTAGRNPYEDPIAGKILTNLAFRHARKIESMIRDGIEQMCAQILTTGTITCVDDANATVAGPYNFYPLDASGTLASGDLIVTSGTTEWAVGGGSGDPIDNIQTLSDNMRARGYNPKRAIFGASAWQRFMANTTVQAHANFRRVNLVDINPTPAPEGATRLGTFMVGENAFEFFTYNGTYKAPYGGTITPYLGSTTVVLMADAPGGLQMTFGAIDYFEQAVDTNALPYLPRQMNFAQGGFGMSMYAYFTKDAKTLVINVGTRVLPLPKAIDSFASLYVGA